VTTGRHKCLILSQSDQPAALPKPTSVDQRLWHVGGLLTFCCDELVNVACPAMRKADECGGGASTVLGGVPKPRQRHAGYMFDCAVLLLPAHPAVTTMSQCICTAPTLSSVVPHAHAGPCFCLALLPCCCECRTRSVFHFGLPCFLTFYVQPSSCTRPRFGCGCAMLSAWSHLAF